LDNNIASGFNPKVIGPLSLVAIGYLVEKNFVGRIATFSNGMRTLE